MKEIYSGVIPFVVLSIIGILVCVFFPQIITVLPNMMYS